MKQKKIFLESEADEWFKRNQSILSGRDYSTEDPLISIVAEIVLLSDTKKPSDIRILEIGCGDGRRLGWVAENFGCDVYGIEPSSAAVLEANIHGIKVDRGTADSLPYPNEMFDLVIYGFCLYLCDREDYFRIACEADRVLKKNSWLLIMDFFSPTPIQAEYRHRAGIYTTKMDFRKLFDWHPAYTNYLHRISHHVSGGYTDDKNEWVSTSCLRKEVTPHV